MSIDEKVAHAARLIHQSCHMVAFTGAGHSTASGIPDFRSPESGLWEKHNPMLVASIWAFRLNPKTFYDWVRPRPIHYSTPHQIPPTLPWPTWRNWVFENSHHPKH